MSTGKEAITVVYGADPQSDATIERLESMAIPYVAVPADSEQGKALLESSRFQGPPAVYAEGDQWCGHRPDKLDELERRQRKSKGSFLSTIAERAGRMLTGRNEPAHGLGKERHGR